MTCCRSAHGLSIMSPVSCFFRSKTGSWSPFLLLSLWLDIGLIALFDWVKCLETEGFAVHFLILEMFSQRTQRIEKSKRHFLLFQLEIFYIFLYQNLRFSRLSFSIDFALICKIMWNYIALLWSIQTVILPLFLHSALATLVEWTYHSKRIKPSNFSVRAALNWYCI